MAYRKKNYTSKSSQQKRKGRKSVSKKSTTVRKVFSKAQMKAYVQAVREHRGEEE